METVTLLWLGCELYLEFLAWRTLLHFRYYGNSMERQPTITVTEYEDNKAENIRNIGYSLQRSTTDSIISYTANGNFSLLLLEILRSWNISDRAETLGSTFFITKEGNINLAIVLQVTKVFKCQREPFQSTSCHFQLRVNPFKEALKI